VILTVTEKLSNVTVNYIYTEVVTKEKATKV